MANAVDGAGAVDQFMMQACGRVNITDMSFLEVCWCSVEPPELSVLVAVCNGLTHLS